MIDLASVAAAITPAVLMAIMMGAGLSWSAIKGLMDYRQQKSVGESQLELMKKSMEANQAALSRQFEKAEKDAYKYTDMFQEIYKQKTQERKAAKEQQMLMDLMEMRENSRNRQMMMGLGTIQSAMGAGDTLVNAAGSLSPLPSSSITGLLRG